MAFSFYFVNLLQFCTKVRMFSTKAFVSILAQLFYFHIYNIILVLGEAVLKSEMKIWHPIMRKWVSYNFEINFLDTNFFMILHFKS